MDRYGPVSDSEKRSARHAGMAKLPLYAVGLLYPLIFLLWRPGFDQWLAGPNAYLLFSTCVLVSIFTSKGDQVVAGFILHKWLPPIGVFMAVMMILPLLIIAGFAAHYGLDGSEVPWRVAACLLALPYFSLLLYACISGLRDPFWPAAMRKKLDEAKAGTA